MLRGDTKSIKFYLKMDVNKFLLKYTSKQVRLDVIRGLVNLSIIVIKALSIAKQ